MTGPIGQPMTPAALHPAPRARDVLRAQVRAAGIALRRPAWAAAGLLALATVLAASTTFHGGGGIAFHPEHQMLPGVAGLLLPLFVWMGEERFGAGFFWTLPVDRRRHALAKVFAGWIWLMAAVALFVLWLLALALASGGQVLAAETIRVLPRSAFLAHSVIETAALRSVPWAPRPLLWLVPFTAATGTYLLASALALGARRPWRWIVAAVAALFLVTAVGRVTGSELLVNAPERLSRWLLESRYGLDALLTARTESLKTEATLPTGEQVVVWRGLPTLGEWATATTLWTTAGLVALWAAASRHRESRRG